MAVGLSEVTTVSVITICLNAAGTIEKTILSVREQSYPHIEHVIIDGGSTDGTLEIIARYRDRIGYLVSEKDNGLYHAMNKGIKASSGDILLFLNADDWLADSKVVTDVMAEFEKDATLEMVYGDALRDYEHGQVRWVQPDQFSRRTLARGTICHQAVFARRKLLVGANRFSEEYRVVSDLDWLIRMAEMRVHHRHINRTITIFGVQGRSNVSNWWEAERRRMMRRYYTRSEIFFWRILPQKLRAIRRNLRPIELSLKRYYRRYLKPIQRKLRRIYR